MAADGVDGAHGRIPDFFIVGTPKTGTTSMHKMLRKHPQIYMPALKEPRFLADDLRPDPKHASGRDESDYPQTMEEYLALFADAAPEQRAGEATTSYLWSRTAASNIAELQPAARIIAILREPASFLRSFHLQSLKVGNETEDDLRTALSLEGDRREGRKIPRRAHRPALLQYSQHMRYVEQLERYRERLGRERMLVLIYDDFHADANGTARRVLRFLEVDEEQPIPMRRANQSAAVRSRRMQGVVGAISRRDSRLHHVVRTLTPRPLRERSPAIRQRLVLRAPPEPDESLMLELRRRFKGEVVALSEYLDRDLVSLWGYDQLG